MSTVDYEGDDLIDQAQVAALLRIKPTMVRKYMHGHKGKPPLPYVRPGRKPFYSKRQVGRWLQRVQEEVVDVVMVDVKRAHREQGKT